MTQVLVGNVARGNFEVYDPVTQVPINGLTAGDFAILLAKDGVDNGTTVTVTATGSGRYSATFPVGATPAEWRLTIRSTAYNPTGWGEDFEAIYDPLDVPAAIDGYTQRQILKGLAAVEMGTVTGGPATPVFKAVDGSGPRVATVADANGNRSSEILTL